MKIPNDKTELTGRAAAAPIDISRVGNGARAGKATSPPLAPVPAQQVAERQVPVDRALAQRPIAPPRAPEGATMSPASSTRIAFHPWAGELPDDPDALFGIISSPESVGHAIAAIRKLNKVTGQDIVANMMAWPPQEFGPVVQSYAIVGKPDLMGQFAAYAVPLRRSLAERYQPVTPEVGMLLDILVLAYFRVVHLERLTSVSLDAAFSSTDGLEKAFHLQRLFDQAQKQIHRALDSLKLLTGVGNGIETEEEISATLELRKRRTTRGQRRSDPSRG